MPAHMSGNDSKNKDSRNNVRVSIKVTPNNNNHNNNRPLNSMLVILRNRKVF